MHIKSLSMSHTPIECVKAAGIALMEKCKLTALACPKCEAVVLEQKVPAHGIHTCACCGNRWKVNGVCVCVQTLLLICVRASRNRVLSLWKRSGSGSSCQLQSLHAKHVIMLYTWPLWNKLVTCTLPINLRMVGRHLSMNLKGQKNCFRNCKPAFLTCLLNHSTQLPSTACH